MIDPSNLPNVSVLVAARNEESCILDCLKSLEKLNYPAHKIDFLIGNDASTDSTERIVREFVEGKPNFFLFNIEKNTANLKGKPNVLAQLAKEATGIYFFFTDADIEVPKEWIHQSLVCFAQNPKLGILTGFTWIKSKSLFQHLQALDWTMALTILKMLADIKIPITSMGNNMVVSKEAYQTVGGFENLSFSLTEDYALFQAITAQSFDFQHIIQPENIALTKPVETLSDWLQQRKRWMSGAMQVNWKKKLFLFTLILFTPFCCMLLFWKPMLGLGLLLGKISLQSILIYKTLHKIRHLTLVKYILLYELYFGILYGMLMIYYFLPIPIVWKNRYYA